MSYFFFEEEEVMSSQSSQCGKPNQSVYKCAHFCKSDTICIRHVFQNVCSDVHMVWGVCEEEKTLIILKLKAFANIVWREKERTDGALGSERSPNFTYASMCVSKCNMLECVYV